MKKLLLLTFILSSLYTTAQKVDSIYVNLYTDSLKKGTFNYINIDGKLSNGQFLPLDSTHLIFWSSAGQFTGNSLWIEPNFVTDKIDIKVSLRNNPSISKAVTIYIKKAPDPALKTMEELMKKSKSKKGRK